MSQEQGKFIKCDRCNRTIFLKYLGQGETDGGYTTWDKFEDPPKEWACGSIVIGEPYVDLCPRCSAKHRDLVRRFMREDILKDEPE